MEAIMTNESKTLFIPLYSKALMSREGFFPDKTAEEIVDSCGYDFSDVDKSKKLAIYMAMRAMHYDELTDRFIQRFPDCIVIHLGCGLDSRCNRTEHKPKLWYDLDLAEVIELRKQYFSESDCYKMIASSAADMQWLSSVEYNGERVLVIAEGLSMYLSIDDMTEIMKALSARFEKCSFVFDAYSNAAAKLSKFKNPINAVDAKIDFSMSDPAVLEKRVENAKCVINKPIILKRYIDRLNGIYKARFTFMGGFGSSFYRIYGFRLW